MSLIAKLKNMLGMGGTTGGMNETNANANADAKDTKKETCDCCGGNCCQDKSGANTAECACCNGGTGSACTCMVK